jgi:nucleotide-binding universal stress UspA family protein
MYSKILVPLDGSELAECSLKHVKDIASGCHIPEVILLSVVEPAELAIPPFWGTVAGTQTRLEGDKSRGTTAVIDYGKMRSEQQAARDKKQAEYAGDYLAKVAEKLKKEGLNISTCVVFGKPAESIINYTSDNGVDFIVMASHGRGGNARWDFGKVTDGVIRGSNVPVLIASPNGCRI